MPIYSETGYASVFIDPDKTEGLCVRCNELVCGCKRCEICGGLADFICDTVPMCKSCDAMMAEEWPPERGDRLDHDHRALPDGRVPATYYTGAGRAESVPSGSTSPAWKGRDRR